jgi:flagellar biosynthetic protein FlhB
VAEDQASKTEEPTGKRIQESRNKGQVAISNEVKSWFILLAGTLLLVGVAPMMMRDLNLVIAKFITMPDIIPMDPRHIRHFFARELVNLAKVMAPFFGVMVIVAIFASAVQTGFLWAPKKIKPELRKISIIAGVKRVFGTRAMIEFAKGLIKLAIVAVVAGGLALPYLKDLELFPFLDVVQTLDRVQQTTLLLMAGTVAVMTVIAGLDFFYQKYSNHQQMKMTKQEVRDEYRQQEGDPMIKSRIRQLRMERARSRMMAAVPQADVVITNPTHYAVALEYKMDTMPAPKLIAKGIDKVAFRIREVAEENDVPVVENAPLARALYATVELDEEIPEEHYKAVAEVIGYVMRLKGKMPR